MRLEWAPPTLRPWTGGLVPRVCFIGFLKRSDFSHLHKKGPQPTTEPRFLGHCVTTLKDFPENLIAAVVPAQFCPAMWPGDTSDSGHLEQSPGAGSLPGWITLTFKTTRRSEIHRF